MNKMTLCVKRTQDRLSKFGSMSSTSLISLGDSA